MASNENGSWHNAHGVGLPYRRPPTVDEALPYSPFTSIVPFSLDLIPFPSAEPPTPPSSLTPDQHKAAQKAVGILNDEIKGQSTAQHLHDTLNQLRDLLRADKLPTYNFKPMPQLATPPPDSPVKDTNGTSSSHVPELSPFASMLLKHADVDFKSFEVRLPEPYRQEATPSRKVAQPATPNGKAHLYNSELPYPSSALSSVPNSTPAQPPGPTVLIQKSKSVRHEEYKRYDNIDTPDSLSQKKKDARRHQDSTSDLRPHEREIVDRKLDELQALVSTLSEDKEDPDESQYFTKVATLDGDFSVLQPRSTDNLSDRMAHVINLGHFPALPVDVVVKIQSLLDPRVTSTTKQELFPRDQGELEMTEGIESARFGLKASKLILETMIEGQDDHRMRREELIDTIINLVRLIKDTCIIPIVQSRRSGDAEDLFNAAAGRKKELQVVLNLCANLLGRFATLIGQYNLSDRALNALEFLTLELVLEQNSEYDKDSIFGIGNFEHFRQKAMDVLTQIFARHIHQRTSILSGIFSNLEKLPDRKASARQFKSLHEVPIMTISAMFMRFVQVAATNREAHNPAETVSTREVFEQEDSDYESKASNTKKAPKQNKCHESPAEIAKQLLANAKHIAQRIASSLIERASNVSKTGDKPFRNLLDLFVDDFCNVLGSPQWPAAVMLLEQLLVQLRSRLPTEIDPPVKYPVIDKDMAITIMDRIGCGILEYQHALKRLKKELDISQSDLSSKLDRLVDDAMSEDLKERVHEVDLFAFDGPFRMVIESLVGYLKLQPSQDDPHLRSIAGCYVTTWLAAVTAEKCPQPAKDAQQHLESMIVDHKWLGLKFKFQAVSEKQSKLAAGIITLQSPVCQFVPHMVSIMLHYARDKGSSKLRSKGITAIEHFIEQNPRVIGEGNIKSMAGSLSDPSPLVREKTLKLVTKCLKSDLALERHVLPTILNMTTDPSTGPKKRAIELLRDIYAGSSSNENKLKIVASLLLPSQDDEKSIADSSRGALEEIWLSVKLRDTKSSAAKMDSNQLKRDREDRASLLVDIVESISGRTIYLEAFEKFFIHVLSSESTNSTSNLKTCTELVAELIDRVIDPAFGSGVSSQARVLNTLSVFAKVKPSLFTFDQVRTLKLYTKHVVNTDDLSLVRPVVVIYRHVFPTLPSLQHAFADEIRSILTGNLAKLAKSAQDTPTSKETLIDVVHCLRTISSMSDMGWDKLCTIIASTLCPLQSLLFSIKEALAKPENRGKILSYLILLGTFGKVCNLDQHIGTFRSRVTLQARALINKRLVTEAQMSLLTDGKSSASLMLLSTVRPWTEQTWDLGIRAQALQSLGGICQQSPELFQDESVTKVLEQVLSDRDNTSLRRIALSFFNEYLTFAERRSDTGAQISIGRGAVTGSARLETSFGATENDGATMFLKEKFMPSFKDSALTTDDELAVLATNIIASISRQGLVYPKVCGAALIALCTSRNVHIAQVASIEFLRISQKQNSFLEQEYMPAVRIAFDYQCRIYNDSHGMWETTHSAKLATLFEAVKIDKKSTIKKFIGNLCKQVDFDISTLEASSTTPDAILFARFCLENVALFDFSTVEELAVFFDAAEAIVLKNTGPAVAMAIEIEMPKQYVPLEPLLVQDLLSPQLQEIGGIDSEFPSVFETRSMGSQIAQPAIADARLRQITTACMILQMVWETRAFVRRCYNLHKLRGRIPQKDYAKPANRHNFVSGKELWDHLKSIMSALDNRDNMLKQCYDFADLLEIDRETRVGDEDDENSLGAGYETPNENGDDANTITLPTSGRGRKRKSNVNLGNTPKKARGRPTGGAKGKKRNSKTPSGEDDSD